MIASFGLFSVLGGEMRVYSFKPVLCLSCFCWMLSRK